MILQHQVFDNMFCRQLAARPWALRCACHAQRTSRHSEDFPEILCICAAFSFCNAGL